MNFKLIICAILGHKLPENPTLVEALDECECRRCKLFIKTQPELLIPMVVYTEILEGCRTQQRGILLLTYYY